MSNTSPTPKRPERVLGIDPGTRHMGWGVVERDGLRVRGIAAGSIDAKESDSLERRLHQVHDGLVQVIAMHSPTVVAVEEIFYAKFAQAALRLGHARGVALLAAAQAGLTVHAYPPSLVKRTVAGRGSSSKEQVAQIVMAMLGLRTAFPIDATDALAIAITHASAASVARMPVPPKPARPRRTKKP